MASIFFLLIPNKNPGIRPRALRAIVRETQRIESRGNKRFEMRGLKEEKTKSLHGAQTGT
jgi:hypothetical protein